jgi:hypothetical protein
MRLCLAGESMAALRTCGFRRLLWEGSMKKRIIAALAASLALMALASTAGAAITIAQAPAGPGYQNLSPWTCNGRTFSASGNPIRLGFGWAAHTASQMRQFFLYSHGSVSISGSDTFSDSWADNPSGDPFVTAQNIAWSSLESIQATPPGGGASVQAVASNYRGVLSLAPGTYTLSVQFVFDRPVQDGFQSYRGTLSNSPCTFTVTA